MLRIIRTLKVDILTLFLTLNIISILCVISINYFENYLAVNRFSTDVGARIGKVATDRIAASGVKMTDSLNRAPVNIIPGGNLYADNQELVTFMLNTIRYNPDIAKFFIATADGQAILVNNIKLSLQAYYLTEPSKPLPTGVNYVVRVINLKNKPASETWYYKDAGFNTLASESTSRAMDMRTRPWYQAALQKQGIAWTDFYTFSDIPQTGISAAKAIRNNQQQVIGVIGASFSNLSFEAISGFLRSSGSNHNLSLGQVFILNQDGKIVMPGKEKIAQFAEGAQAVTQGYQVYSKTQEKFFFVKDKQGNKHAIYIAPLTNDFGQNWLVAIAAPYNNFFATLFRAQLLIGLIALFILIVSVFIIIGFAKRISSPIVALANEIDKIKRLEFDDSGRVDSHIKEIQLMDESVAAMKTTLRSFTRYVPKEIVKELLLRGKDITLEGEKKEVTILFSDIQDFTTIAEKNTAETLMLLLSEYFDGISKIIIENKGTIDKYIGDAVMAFWGAPVEQAQHAEWACLAALRCQAFLVEFNAKRRNEGKPEFITRFGLNTGKVIVGNLGTLERMNYTMIGDAVNIASRLENLDKVYHVTILISEKVLKQIGKQFLTRHLDLVRVKGKFRKIKVYELVASLQDEENIRATVEQIEFCQRFNAAYLAFMAKKFDKAKILFEAIHTSYPDDYPTQLYLQRIKNHHSSV